MLSLLVMVGFVFWIGLVLSLVLICYGLFILCCLFGIFRFDLGGWTLCWCG